MLKFSTKILVFVSILLASGQAAAGLVDSLYDVEIPVVDESADARNQAFDQGLDEVFIRLSGDSIIMDKLKRPAASRYVKQFSYEPLANPIIGDAENNDAEMLTFRLKLQYNGSLIEKYLLENGFPVWGEYRPDVVVWLVVRDGRNEYVLKDSDQSLLKTTAIGALTRRGIPARWPLYDLKDKKALNVAEIRGGFKEPVIKASQRYATETALTGSMIWNGSQWSSSWSLFVEGENRHWILDDTDYKQLINKAINQAADMLGVAFAVHNTANKEQAVSLQIDIQAVNSIEKYRFAENYLSGLSAVEKVKPFKIDGQNAVFIVSLRSDEKDFLNLIKNDAQLVKLKAPQINTTMDNTLPPAIQTVAENDATSAAKNDSLNSIEKAAVQKQVEKTEVSPAPPPMPVYYYRLNKK